MGVTLGGMRVAPQAEFDDSLPVVRLLVIGELLGEALVSFSLVPSVLSILV